MNNRILGIIVAVLGLLMTCCTCPLVINSLVFILTSGGKPVSLYGQVFSARIGNLSAATYISAGQTVCVLSLALLVLIVGVVMVVQEVRSRAAGQ